MNLQHEIKKDAYGKILLSITFFKENFSSEFIKSLSIKMINKKYTPEHLIFKVTLLQLYFISI